MSALFLASAVIILSSNKECISQLIASRGPPEVERPLLLNSYLPASMQIIAHLTELMKYETKPSDGLTTTSTVRPTPAHKPGLYSPQKPSEYFLQKSLYDEYMQRLQHPFGVNYFDRYGYLIEDNGNEGAVLSNLNTESETVKFERSTYTNDLPSGIDLLGPGPASLLKLVNKIEDYDLNDDDDDDKLRKFSETYDDSYLREFVIGNKKPPPVQAYVTLLQLYDLLNQESKKLQLNKYGGYTSEVLQVLAEISKGTSAEQLRSVLKKLVEQRNTRNRKINEKITSLLTDLDNPKSYINDALKYIPPLYFVL